MKKGTGKPKAKRLVARSPRTKGGDAPADYVEVLADMKRLIADSRHRALATVNRELVCLYWQIGYVIVQQQEKANWGDAVVEQLATDLRAAFPDMKGLSRDNLWRMRQFFLSVRDVDGWCQENLSTTDADRSAEKLGTLSRDSKTNTANPILGTLSRELASAALIQLVPSQSWSHHTEIMSIRDRPDERYFYMAMSARERWSVRELRRQIDSACTCVTCPSGTIPKSACPPTPSKATYCRSRTTTSWSSSG
jgi:predicted nuclease of restriction endonuclease-like (RecB) superfamily